MAKGAEVRSGCVAQGAPLISSNTGVGSAEAGQMSSSGRAFFGYPERF